MAQHYTPYRDIPFDVTTGDRIYPPIGWYFDHVICVEGNHSPHNRPLDIENWSDMPCEGIPRVGGETMLNVPDLAVNLHFRHDQIGVFAGIAGTTMNGFQQAFITVRVRPTASFVSQRFDDFNQENPNLVIVEFWSVRTGTKCPSMREDYFPALNREDTLLGLHKQNKALKEVGHELMVRYYEHV